MKLSLGFINAIDRVIDFFERSEPANLLLPEFFKGEILSNGTGKTCLVLEIHTDSMEGISYTVLQEGIIWPKISASIFSNWKPITEVDQDPFMLTR